MTHSNTVAYSAGAVCCRHQAGVHRQEALGYAATWWVSRRIGGEHAVCYSAARAALAERRWSR